MQAIDTIRKAGLAEKEVRAGIAIAKNNLTAFMYPMAKSPAFAIDGRILARGKITCAWGVQLVLENAPCALLSLLVIDAGRSTGWQCHKDRAGSFYVLDGIILARNGSGGDRYGKNCGWVVGKNMDHMLYASTSGPAIVAMALSPPINGGAPEYGFGKFEPFSEPIMIFSG